MGAFPIQYDFEPGFDLSGVASASQSQVMQALSQMTPVSNIGLVVVGSGAGGANWPAIANNARFENYIWLDTDPAYGTYPVIKVKTGAGDTYADWTATAIANNSITTAMLQDLSVTIAKLNSTGGVADQLIKVNSTGGFDFVDFSALLIANKVPLAAIDTTTAIDKQVLQFQSGPGVVYANLDASILGAGSVTFDKLPTGVPYRTLRASSPSGVVEIAQFSPSLQIADGDIPLTKLDPQANVNDVLYFDGSNIVATSLSTLVKVYRSPAPVAFGAAGNLMINGVAHGLGGIPDIIYGSVVCVADDAASGYTKDDEFPLSSLLGQSDTIGAPVMIKATAAALTVRFNAAGTFQIRNVTTGAYSAPTAVANFSLKIFAIKFIAI